MCLEEIHCRCFADEILQNDQIRRSLLERRKPYKASCENAEKSCPCLYKNKGVAHSPL